MRYTSQPAHQQSLFIPLFSLMQAALWYFASGSAFACPPCLSRRALKDHLLATAASLTGGTVSSSGASRPGTAITGAAEPSAKRSKAGSKGSAASAGARAGKAVAGKRRKGQVRVKALRHAHK